MATPGALSSGSKRTTTARRSRPQSLFYKDLAATPVPGAGAGKLGSSPSWREHSGGIDHLPPPPCATLEDAYMDGSLSGGDSLDIRSSSFSSIGGGSFLRRDSQPRGTPPRQDSGSRRSFGSPYSGDPVQQGFPMHSPLRSQKLQFQSPDRGKGKEVLDPHVETPEQQDMQISPVSFVRPDLSARDELEEWVTVYGFASDDHQLVFREFEKCGPFVNYLPGPEGSNFLHIQFQNKHDAQKALQKNGMQLSNSLLVGVKPVDSVHVAALKQLSQRYESVPSPAQTPTRDVITASTARPYYLNGAEAQGPQPLRPIASPVRSAVSRLVDLVFGV